MANNVEILAEIRSDTENGKEVWHLGCICCERLPQLLELVDELRETNLNNIMCAEMQVKDLQAQVRKLGGR